VPRLVTLALVALALLGAIAPPAAEFAATGSTEAAAAPTGPSAPAPSSMDALGDSFTRGLYSGGCGTSATCANNSWSTGTTVGLQSHYQRLVALNPALSGHAINRAVSGRKMDYLDTEVKAAIADAPAYVTIMMGLNDVCGGSLTPNTMTAPSVVGSQLRTAMSDLTSHLPAVRVFVASIPNPYTLWQILHTNTSATSAWNAQQVCPTMLKNPTSTAPADVSRRATVRQRVVDDNAQIQQVCSQFTQVPVRHQRRLQLALGPERREHGRLFPPLTPGPGRPRSHHLPGRLQLRRSDRPAEDLELQSDERGGGHHLGEDRRREPHRRDGRQVQRQPGEFPRRQRHPDHGDGAEGCDNRHDRGDDLVGDRDERLQVHGYLHGLCLLAELRTARHSRHGRRSRVHEPEHRQVQRDERERDHLRLLVPTEGDGPDRRDKWADQRDEDDIADDQQQREELQRHRIHAAVDLGLHALVRTDWDARLGQRQRALRSEFGHLQRQGGELPDLKLEPDQGDRASWGDERPDQGYDTGWDSHEPVELHGDFLNHEL